MILRPGRKYDVAGRQAVYLFESGSAGIAGFGISGWHSYYFAYREGEQVITAKVPTRFVSNRKELSDVLFNPFVMIYRPPEDKSDPKNSEEQRWLELDKMLRRCRL